VIDYAVFVVAVAVVAALPLLAVRARSGRAPSLSRAVARVAVATAASLLLVGYASYELSNARTIQVMGQIVPRVETSDPVIALTFDDGPLAGPTERVLEMLAEREARATFFLIGEAIARNPDQARRIVEAGHEIGNHSYRHPRFLGLSLGRIAEEIDSTDRLIQGAGHVGPIHFRSPYGKKYVALPLHLSRTGRANIFWDVAPDGDPAMAADSARIVRHVLENARPGSIVLMHVMTRHYAASLAAVPAIVDGLRERGYELVTVTELLERR
jgi:peptidoglycan-N-acetylglucosamine deacetylase